jgi:hypothetical protein
MKRLLLAALLLFSSLAGVRAENTIGPSNQVLCNKSITIATGGSTTAQVIAAISGQAIFICGWHVTNTAASGTFALVYGTGSNCGTGTTALLQAMNVTNTAPSSDHISIASLSTPINQALCWAPSVATISGIIYYSQF